MTGTAVSTRNDIKAALAKYEDSIQKMLPAGYEASRLITGAMVAITTNPALGKCKPVTIATSLARIAQWSLDVGTTAHLVPFGDTCTPVADYRGLITLMCRAGARKVEAFVVREGDHFDIQYGTDPRIVHQPNSHDKPITGAYAVVHLRGGVVQFEYQPIEEIDAVRRKNSRSWSKGDCPPWWAKKRMIRVVAKYVPQTPELARALTEDEVPLEMDEDGVVLSPAELDGKYERTRIGRSSSADRDDPYNATERPRKPSAEVETVVVDMSTKPTKSDLFAGEPDVYAPGDAAEE